MRRQKLLFLAVPLFSFLLADFVAGRIFTYLDTRRMHEIQEIQAEERAVREESPIYHHGLKPSARGRALWGPQRYELVTNSLGFKDATTRDVSLASNGHRVLIIGDSFAEGSGIDYERTFAGLVDAELRGRHVEILNAAVLSYSPIIYLRKVQYLLEDVGLDFDELVVFLDISDIQDETLYYFDENSNVKKVEEERTDVSKTLRARAKRLLKENSILARTLRELRNVVFSDHWAPVQRSIRLCDWRSRWTVDDEVFEHYGRRGLENADRNLTQLRELLRVRGIPMTLVVYPWPRQIQHRDLDSRQVRYWKDWSERHGVAFQNHFPAFIDERPFEEVIRRYFISGDIHWNDEGHRLIAERFLAEWQPAIAP